MSTKDTLGWHLFLREWSFKVPLKNNDFYIKAKKRGMHMICNHCGKEVEETDMFCAYCGGALEKKETVEGNRTEQTYNGIII